MAAARDVLLDTGPLVAVLDARDQWHRACAAVWPEVINRCVTTEAVVAEACHLALRGRASASAPIRFLATAGIPVLSLPVGGLERAATLMDRYERLPMDFADATLVAVAEALQIATVFTTDRRGFAAYRRPRARHFEILPER